MTAPDLPRLRDLAGMQAFIQANTRLLPVAGLAGAGAPLLLWQADAVTPIWSATETDLNRQGIDPPFWAFPWAGGQAIARLILEQPHIVEGKCVLDIACGSGLIAIAAARAGAAQVVANDIDPLCEAAVALNAAANGVTVAWRGGDLLGGPAPDVDVIVAGDVFYQRQMADRFVEWLSRAAEGGAAVYAGDPGRAYAPRDLAPPVAEYDIDTSLDLESAVFRRTRVWRL